jgi:hypothetical protein
MEPQDPLEVDVVAFLRRTADMLGEFNGRLDVIEKRVTALEYNMQGARELQEQLGAIAPKMNELLKQVRTLFDRRKNAPDVVN